MSVLKAARQKAGYDNEEFWFHQRDRELIEKMKKPQLKLIRGGADQGEKAQPESPPSQEQQYTPKKKAA